MRTLVKNSQKMKYALLIGEEDIYSLDDNGNKIVTYTDADGTVYYEKTGEKRLVYSEPIEFFGSIVEYGIDTSSYDAILVVNKGSLPITETSLIWYTSEVGYTSNNASVDPNTADYRVKSIRPSLNEIKYVLERLVK